MARGSAECSVSPRKRSTRRLRHRRLWLSRVAVTPAGVAVVSWVRGDRGSSQLQAAIRWPGHRFGSAFTLGQCDDPPAVAVGSDGTVVLAWLTPARFPMPGESPLAGNPRLLVAMLFPGTTAIGDPTQLAGPPAWVLAPSAVGGVGRAGVTWLEGTSLGTAARIALLGPDGRFATIDSPPASVVTLAMAVDGGLTALWLAHGGQVWSSFRPVRGSFLPEQQVSAGGSRAILLPIAVVVGQLTVATWSESTPSRRARLRIAARPNRGEWSAPRTLWTATSIAPVAAAADNDRTLIAWIAFDRRSRGRLYLAQVRLTATGGPR
jgi:hypothetical protein